jgi:hypothetical protein
MMTRDEANAIIQRHSANPSSVEYPDYARAGLTVWHYEQQRRAAENGPVGTIDGVAKRRRTHDTAQHVHVYLPLTTDQETLGSGPELKGSRSGNTGAMEAWTSTPPIAELDGRAEDYRVIDREDGRGCALYRRASKDSKARTGDRFSWGFSPRVQQRDAAQHSILKGINEAHAAGWSSPERQGKW